MNFLETHPDYKNFSDEDLIKNIPANTLIAILPEVSKYYDTKIRMSWVYQLYGYALDDTADQQQIPCLLPSHGTSDKHPSSRFYAVDRNTNVLRHAIYCFKCQRTVTPFWLLYTKEAEKGVRVRGLFLYIQKIFRLDFPRGVLYSFDAEAYYTMEQSEVASKRQKFQHAEVLLKMKLAKDPSYLSELKRFMTEG